jgi:hypothetical protein
MLLRSDAEFALDEALLAAAEAGRVYREAAFKCQSPIRPQLAEAANLRDRIAEELAEASRQAGWLPRAPDPDAEAARAIGDEIQVAIAGECEAPLEAERRKADEDAVGKLRQLLAVDGLPASVAGIASRLLGALEKSASISL